ncbi:MAG: Sulfate transporter/antisigma-factor antagonist [Frankiales bacterium]|nr:Sulfate transporter/antisigma-factor antagonist [Frankiales bacterium]
MTVLSGAPLPRVGDAAHQESVRTPVIELFVDEELDIATLPRLRERLEDALSLQPARLVLDLRQCVFLDAQAMTVLLDIHRQAWRQGGLLTLRGCSPQCLRLLSLAGLLGVFDLQPAGDHEVPQPRLSVV